ncbi:unnamed protein product [Somion occarium]|uniref:Arrestin C-terminal-like domain-containing protein n=1 Tax=Somion occarium TaxID=3059160 RepID=A0ABP1DEQ7_9APHY
MGLIEQFDGREEQRPEAAPILSGGGAEECAWRRPRERASYPLQLGRSGYTVLFLPPFMSQPKLTLRPPPNIDFVQGYPGIPPGAPDRPQAAVKGAIEFRAGPQGVKAKWVRIELRKVETLPGGGLTNTFFDFVGQSPIHVWQSGAEYSTLSSTDFPFYIRIPESIPPSIALEKGAGVKYELIATVCVKGKKGFLRRDKHNILSQSAPIIIDKHELHSTWPVYTQPEGRKLTQDGVTLTVERTHTCYGPGDRISVMAAVKSDSLSTVILRGFEFSLRETTVFRAGPNTPGKKGSPQVKVSNIGEQKVPVNATLYGGTQHKAELAVTVPSHHTSTTLNAARHIDINYVLTVRALMGTGKPLIMDLPIIISNWPRSVSLEAVKRIGIAPNVSGHPQAAPPHGQASHQLGATTSGAISPPPAVTSPVSTITSLPAGGPSLSQTHPYSTTVSERPTSGGSMPMSDTNISARFNTAPVPNGYPKANEWGVTNKPAQPQTIGGSQVGPSAAQYPANSDASSSSGNNQGQSQLRTRTSGRAAVNRPLTVANYNEDNPEEAVQAQQAAQLVANARSHARQASLQARQSSVAGSSSSRTNQWLSAEEEKRRLYDRAVAQVERVQGGVARAPSPPTETYGQQTPHKDAGPIVKANGSPGSISSSSRWPTAEEEKMRLFNEAQAAARRLQGLEEDAGASSSYVAPSRSAAASPQSSMSAGAAMYQQAMSSINRNALASSSSAPRTTALPIKSPTPQYPSAEEEKAALRRYEAAKAAVDRSQGSPSYSPSPDLEPPDSAPIAYDALYPPAPTTAPPVPPINGDLPPAFDQGSSQPQPNYLTEKEKLRRAYEAQDAAAAAGLQASPALSAVGGLPMNAPAYVKSASPPPPQVPQGPSQLLSAVAEKERLRKMYEAQDSAATSSGPPAPPPPRPRGNTVNGTSGSTRPALPTPRSPPIPPGGSGPQPLTAAEEKARLRAMYEAEGRQNSQPNGAPAYSQVSSPVLSQNGVQRLPSLSAVSRPNGVPAPPPLMPRPPKEYIQETQEEDYRIGSKLRAIDQENGFNSLNANDGSLQPPLPVKSLYID